jgi:autotransporter-associated beta strand protein
LPAPSPSVGGSGNITLSGSVNSGNNVLTKTGSGTLTLSGATDNNSLGVTVTSGTVVLAKTSSGSPNDVHAVGSPGILVNGGTAQLGGTGGDQIFDSGGVTVTSGAFDTNGLSETVGTLNLQGTGIGGAGALVNSAIGSSTITPTSGTFLTGDATIGVPQSGGTLTLNGGISGSAALTKTGAGTLVVSGTNSFSGGLTVANGILQVLTINNAGTSGSLGNNSSVTLGSSGQTGTLEYTGATASSNMPLSLAIGGMGAIQVDTAATTLTLSGAISGSGALSKTGAGTLALSGTNSFSGGLTVANGTLQIPTINNAGTSGSLGNNSSVTLGSSGQTGTLEYTGGSGSTSSNMPLILAGTGAIQVDSATLTLSGAISGGGALMIGPGSLVLSGNNSFTGGLAVQQGILAIATINNANSNGTLGNNNSVTLGSSGQTGSLVYAGGSASSNMPIMLAAHGTGEILVATQATVLTLQGNISGGSQAVLTKTGPGTLTLSGANTFIGNGAGITLTEGTLHLLGSNTFGTGGRMTLDTGTLLVGNDSALNGAGLEISGPNCTIQAEGAARVLSLNFVNIGNGFTVAGPYDLTLSGNVISGSNVVINVMGAGVATLTGNDLTAAPFTKGGVGTLVLSGANSFFSTTIQGGTLRFGHEVSLNNPAKIVVDTGATAVFNVGGPGEFTASDIQFLNGIEAPGGFQSGSIIGLDTTNAAGGFFDYPNDIADPVTGSQQIPSPSVGLAKLGSGTLRLSGNNTFTGGVTVTSGTLLVASDSALGTGTLTINGGAVDLGTFSISNKINLVAGSLSMTGNLTIGSTGLVGQNINLDSTKFLIVSGTTTIDPDGTLIVSGGTLSTSTLAGAAAFTFMSGTLDITGSGGMTIGSGSLAGASYSLGANDHLNVTNLLHIDATGRLTNPGGNVTAGSMLIDAGGLWTVANGGVQSVGTGLVNHGTLVLINSTINGPVNTPASSTVTVVGSVTFNHSSAEPASSLAPAQPTSTAAIALATARRR